MKCKVHIVNSMHVLFYHISALFALNGMNLPMYSALRRCVPLLSAVLSYLALSKKPTVLVQVSVVFITFGAVIAGKQWFSFWYDM